MISGEDLEVVMIAAACAGAVGVVGIAVAWAIRRWSIRWLLALVALVAVLAVVAGVVGTARAMFLSNHDFQVVLTVATVAGAVAVVSGLLVASMLVSSSRRLQEATRKFAESGEYSAQLTGPAEWRAISAELQRTSENLQKSREREQLLEHSRRELVSWVSHDLRTPLAGMRAMTEALEDRMVEDPERYHRQIRVEVDRMVDLVEDLFELSRINAGLADRPRVDLDVADAISEAIAAAEPVARAKAVDVSGTAPSGLVIRADPVGFSRALANLVSNAVRHTPDGSFVTIVGAPRAGAGGVKVSVEDACGGIAPADLPRVFDTAWSGDPARTPRLIGGATTSTAISQQAANALAPGAGLGLAIVKGIVEGHGGGVEVSNTDQGCVFSIVMP